MPCKDIDEAFNWAKKTTTYDSYPVTAFFTKHQGVRNDPYDQVHPIEGRDYCWYAVGSVSLTETGHLTGDLQLFLNGSTVQNVQDAIAIAPSGSVGVDIAPDGTSVSYQQKINGKPVGGMPPVVVKTSCLGDALLTGTTNSEVVTIGLRRERIVPTPH